MNELKTFPTEMVDFDLLKGAPYNPRRISPTRLAQLKASVLEWGLTVPIVVHDRETMEIIGGHQRCLAIRVLIEDGELAPNPKVPCIFRSDLDETQAKKLNIALNRIGGDWEMDGLRSLIDDIAAHDGGEIVRPEAFGFTLEELDVFDTVGALIDGGDLVAGAGDRRAAGGRPGGGKRKAAFQVFKFAVPVAAAEKVTRAVEAARERGAVLARDLYDQNEFEALSDDDAALLAIVEGFEQSRTKRRKGGNG